MHVSSTPAAPTPPAPTPPAPPPRPAAPPPLVHAPRTLLLLRAPIGPTLLRLAWPNVLVMLAQASTGLIETAFIGRLGTDALAGLALVFPGFMLMQMMSAGAMGGGISAAIARALGAGRRAGADELAFHALVIAALLGLAFTALGLGFGRAFYAALGARGDALHAAAQYSAVVFGGAVLMWLFNAAASCIRGTGNMLVPAVVICAGAVLLVPLSPCLIFGIGPVPALGVVGGGVAMLLYYAVGGAVLGAYLLGRRSLVRPAAVRLRSAAMWDILRVGLVASLVSLQTQIVVAAATAFLSPHGPGAIAGYGTGARLEYLLVPLTFGFGAPTVAMVGTNLGAGQKGRALRAAWTSAGLAFLVTEAIGLAAATWPGAWLRLFGSDPAMIETGSAYLRAVGPFYGAFGGGMALYFAAQGTGRMLWPLIAALARTAVAVGGGALALRWWGLPGLFGALAAGLVVMGAVNAWATAAGTWFRGEPAPARAARP